ncbi:hypothetical protein WN944_005991 [Citrus x changshan-huyou]|uniref:Uncharacterized protein n=1 Tax=Citrus x changshan-huyou TaxID=2935761 RepID=A0AAP0QT32_9ROSI
MRPAGARKRKSSDLKSCNHALEADDNIVSTIVFDSQYDGSISYLSVGVCFEGGIACQKFEDLCELKHSGLKMDKIHAVELIGEVTNVSVYIV